MTFWILVGLMTLSALAFVVVPVVKPGGGRRPLLVVCFVVAIPLTAVLLYQKLGTPEAAIGMSMAGMQADTMPPGHPGQNMEKMDLGQLADKLAEKLKANPDNPEGWALLARTYVEVGRYKDSLYAFEMAVGQLPNDPYLIADYADVLAMSNGGHFDKKTEALINKALTINPNHVKALMLKGTINFDRKDYANAIESWERLLKVPGLDAELAKQTATNIAEAKRLLGAGTQ
jgi:cytochrome c-type biogenesis protein CcmH